MKRIQLVRIGIAVATAMVCIGAYSLIVAAQIAAI